MFKDYYKILGLTEYTNDLEEIKIAYKKQAKTYHPDISNTTTNEIFASISEAYNVLSNPIKKRQYDRLWINSIGKEKKENLTYVHKKRTVSIKDELLNIFFGEMFSTNKNSDIKKDILTGEKFQNHKLNKNLDILSSIDISLEDAFFGNTIQLQIKDENFNTNKIISFKLPAGTTEKDVIRLKKLGKTSIITKKRGDIFFKINIKSTDLKRKNNDIIKNIFLYPWDYVLGKQVDLNIFKENISLTIPKNSSPNKEIIIPNKGFISKSGIRGNLILKTKVMLPKNISKEDEELYLKLKENFINFGK